MSDEQLAAEVAQWVGKIFGEVVGPAARDANLVETYDADSMDIVDIVEGLERKYGVNVPNSEVPNIKTFGDVVRLAAKK